MFICKSRVSHVTAALQPPSILPQDYSVPEISLFPEEEAEGKKVIFRDTSDDARIFGFPIKANSIIINAGLWVMLIYSKCFVKPKLIWYWSFVTSVAFHPIWHLFFCSSGGLCSHSLSSRVYHESWRLGGTQTQQPGGWNSPMWGHYIHSK